MRKNARKLIPALAMLLVSVMMLSTSSYAWFSISESVTVEKMSITARQGVGLYQSPAYADGSKAFENTNISFDVQGELLPTDITLGENVFNFAGAYSESVTNGKVEDESIKTVTTQSVTGVIVDADAENLYSGMIAVPENYNAGEGFEKLTDLYKKGNVAVYTHFFLAKAEDTKSDGTLKCTAKIPAPAENAPADPFAGCVTVALYVGGVYAGSASWEQLISENGAELCVEENIPLIANMTDSGTKGGTEIWVFMYFNGNADECTTVNAAGELEYGGLTLSFSLVQNDDDDEQA